MTSSAVLGVVMKRYRLGFLLVSVGCLSELEAPPTPPATPEDDVEIETEWEVDEEEGVRTLGY